MQNKENNIDADPNFDEHTDSSDRRYVDRRKESKKGFTYISMVGWICRREMPRRKDDDYDSNP